MTSPQPAEPFISLRDVSKRYRTSRGSEVEAVRSVSLNVREGEFISLIGRSGCGKTTVLKIVAGLLEPSSGSVTVAGADVSSPQADVGFVFQSPLLMPWMRVIDNVLLPIELMRLDPKKYLQRATELLRVSGLEGFEGLYPRELSAGMKQRVSIARALVHDPRLFLLDEPFAALDELTREEMSAELLRVVQGMRKTVIFVTHSVPEAVMMGDRVVLLSPRPSTVQLDLRIDLPRPRDASVRTDPRYLSYCEEIRGALGIGVPAVHAS